MAVPRLVSHRPRIFFASPFSTEEYVVSRSCEVVTMAWIAAVRVRSLAGVVGPHREGVSTMFGI